jgi:predicted porin
MHLLAPSTSIGANATRIYSRQEQPLRFDSRNDYLNVRLTHTVSPRTTTFAGVSVSRFDSEEPGFIPNQDSTSVSVGLSHRF